MSRATSEGPCVFIPHLSPEPTTNQEPFFPCELHPLIGVNHSLAPVVCRPECGPGTEASSFPPTPPFRQGPTISSAMFENCVVLWLRLVFRSSNTRLDVLPQIGLWVQPTSRARESVRFRPSLQIQRWAVSMMFPDVSQGFSWNRTTVTNPESNFGPLPNPCAIAIVFAQTDPHRRESDPHRQAAVVRVREKDVLLPLRRRGRS